MKQSKLKASILNRSSINLRPIVHLALLKAWLALTSVRAVFKWLSKTETKAITPTNHNRSEQRDEPITIPSNYL